MAASQTTNGIQVSVNPTYQPEYSQPQRGKFVFSYQVNIENLSEDTVQLLRRHWSIFDSNGVNRQVEGEGVIGEQPVLKPGQSHQYASWCPLTTDMGSMNGYFIFQRLPDNHSFTVVIPEFQLVVPARLN